MKPFFSSVLLVLIAVAISHGQISMVQPKVDDTNKATFQSIPTQFIYAGDIYPQSVDLEWLPILTKKRIEVEHEVPNQKFLDSLQDAELTTQRQYKSQKPEYKATSIIPHVIKEFAAYTPDGNEPLDNSIAISNGGYIVNVENDVISYWDMSGTNTFHSEMTSFLPTSFGVANVCDPVVLYDPYWDRFIFFCQELNASGTIFGNNRVFICFSIDNNPNNGWHCYYITGDQAGNGDEFDYPKLAINDSEVFVTGNLYSGCSSCFRQSVIMQLDKLSGYSGGTLNGVSHYGLTNNPFTLLPVSYGQGTVLSTGMFLLATQVAGGSSIDLYQIIGNWCCSPTINHWTVPTATYSSPIPAPQLGTTTALNPGSCRALSGFYLNGIIHYVFNSRYNTTPYSGFDYHRLYLSSLKDSSYNLGLPTCNISYPSVASFATSATDNSVLISYASSCSSIYPEMDVINIDNHWGISSSALVKNGSFVSYGSTVDRWGDYSGISRKHNSPFPCVWISGGYGNTNNHWATWIAEINDGTKTIVNEVTKSTDAKIYPNPIVEQFNVEFVMDKIENIDISVFDENSRRVKQLYNGVSKYGTNIFSFNKANLTSGIYFLKVSTISKAIKNEKIIIAR